MLRPVDLLVSSILISGVGLLTLFGTVHWNSSSDVPKTAESDSTNVAPTSTFVSSTEPISIAAADDIDFELWQSPLPPVATAPPESPVFLSQPGDAPATEINRVDSDCRLWNVLRPANASLDSFWIGGWVQECNGVMGPVVPLGSEESIEEVYLRLDNAVAQIDRLQQALDAMTESAAQQ